MKKKLEDYMDWPKIEDLEYAECRNAEDVLGAAVVEDGILFRCFFPEADKVLIKIKGKSRTVIMKKMDVKLIVWNNETINFYEQLIM